MEMTSSWQKGRPEYAQIAFQGGSFESTRIILPASVITVVEAEESAASTSPTTQDEVVSNG